MREGMCQEGVGSRFSAMQLFPEAASLLSAEMDHAGERVDQGRGEEVWRREVESHLPEVPLPEPHISDDQGSLADHEETGNALKVGAMGPSVQKPPCFVFWKLDQSAICASVGSPSDTKTMTDRNPGALCSSYICKDQCAAGGRSCAASQHALRTTWIETSLTTAASGMNPSCLLCSGVISRMIS